MTQPETTADADAIDWPEQIFRALKDHDVRQVSFVPDSGHAKLIEKSIADPQIHAVSLTTEEEGVALAAGAWLGGHRSVLLMQSSGVGNCVNMLSLIKTCRFPFLAIVTMRGEWGEFNPWQAPMSTATAPCLEMMGVATQRVDRADQVDETVRAACVSAFEGGSAVALLLSQRLIGLKVFVEEETP